MQDWQLLREYVQKSFVGLVDRYVSLAYSAARHQPGGPVHRKFYRIHNRR